MELYERIRRACHVEGMSIREASRVFGVHRKTVRKILQFSIPPGYQRSGEPKRPKLDAFAGIIDQILESGSTQSQEAAPHGEAHFRAVAGRAWICRWLHHCQGLRAGAEARPTGGFHPVDPRGGPCPGRFWRSPGADWRRRAEGPFFRDGPAAQ